MVTSVCQVTTLSACGPSSVQTLGSDIGTWEVVVSKSQAIWVWNMIDLDQLKENNLCSGNCGCFDHCSAGWTRCREIHPDCSCSLFKSWARRYGLSEGSFKLRMGKENSMRFLFFSHGGSFKGTTSWVSDLWVRTSLSSGTVSSRILGYSFLFLHQVHYHSPFILQASVKCRYCRRTFPDHPL